ncbi:MAG: membrane protein insertase YidC [Lentisphaerae bacterium]|nr:membrane protein insertase YidC [Lentisphaerota bacterium]
MNKKELTVVVLLFAGLLGWIFFQGRQAAAKRQEVPAVESSVEPPAPETAAETVEPPGQPPEETVLAVVETQEPEAVSSAPESLPAVPEPGPLHEEHRAVLGTAEMNLVFSSWGGGVISAELLEYRESMEEDSLPVRLDFSSFPALSLVDLPGLSTNSDFVLSPGSDGASMRIVGESSLGLRLERVVTVGEGYAINIQDTFSNTGAVPVVLPEYGMRMGPMQRILSSAKTRGLTYLGFDTLASFGGEDVKHRGKKISGLFGIQRSMLSCQRPDMSGVGASATQRIDEPLSWAAVKNKFFVQIVVPEDDGATAELVALRDMENPGSLTIREVYASLRYEGKALAPGESLARKHAVYLGPKKHSLLVARGEHQEKIMEFGWFAWLCKPLLWILTGIHKVLPNYGVAIILLTALVRIVFWPVTHKSTESMRKMQSIQPLVSEIRKKHESKPQKMNQEIMALYKEHKVNPMSGCLPIVVQIPVFIALFTVLRSAVELRFASFLWISDLSEPEGLLAGLLPIPLNILPLLMTATMVVQQRLTPSSGDNQQQKMMMIMPVVMLFIFYNMASALVLYWTTSQCLSIAQLLLQRRKKAAEAEA